MKIDFFAYKKFYALHVTAFLGFLNFLLCFLIIRYEPMYLMFIYPIILPLICIPLIFFIIDFTIKSRVKNSFLLNNVFYDILVDIGLLFYITPFFMFLISFFPTNPEYPPIFYFIPLILLFFIFQALKIAQRIRERKQKV